MSQAADDQTAGAGESSLLNGDGAVGDVNDTLLGNAAEEESAGQGSGGAGGGDGEAPTGKPPAAPVPGLAPLPDDATDEQRAEFDKKLRALAGVPQDAAGYGDFGFGEDAKIDTAGEDYRYYTRLFHEAGISRAQARKLLEGHAKYAAEQVEHVRKQSDAQINEYRAQVKRDFIRSVGGDEKFKEYSDVAVRGFKASAQGAGLTKQEITGLLNVMGDDPRFIKIFNGIGRLFREDVLVTGAAPRAQEKTFEDMFAGMFKS